MKDEIKNFADSLRGQIGGTDETSLTVNLTLSRDEFVARMLEEKDGQELLDLMERGEWKVCERLGLTNAYLGEGGARIEVPRWNNLVAHLRIVNSV